MCDHHHAIRLGSAWDPPTKALAGVSSAGVSSAGVALPGVALLAVGERVRWARRFGRPGGIQPGDRVLLVVTESATGAEITLNGVCLPPLLLPCNLPPPNRPPPKRPPPPLAVAARWSHDITDLLRDRNDIVVVVPATVGGDPVCDTQGRSPLPPAIGSIALEIVTPHKATSGAQVGHPA